MLWLASWLALCLRGPAAAQGDYFELVRDAEREFKDGELASSRDLFRRALAARPTSVALYGIAMTSEALSDHAEAVRMARAALIKNDGLLPALQKQHLLDLIDKTLPKVTELIVESSPSNVQIAIDGEVIPAGPENEIVVRPGRRTVRALADGYVPYLTEINARAGTRETLTVELVQPNRPSVLYEDIEAEEDSGPSLVVPIVLVSVGAATLLAGGITGIVALDNEGDLEDRCGALPSQCPKTNTALAHSAEDLALTTNILWVVGGLTSAVGITWLVLALSDDERETAASLDLGPDRAGLRLSGTF
jgi:hypothetical protein